MLRHVFADEEITPAEIPPLAGIRIAPDIAFQVRMVDVDAVVENRHRDAVPQRARPRLARLDHRQMPLLGARRRNRHPLELGNEIRERKGDLGAVGELVGKLAHALGDIGAPRVVDDHLIAVERVARADFEMKLVEQRLALGLRGLRLETNDRLAIDDANGTVLVAKGGALDLVGADPLPFGRGREAVHRLAERRRDHGIGQKRRAPGRRGGRLEHPRPLDHMGCERHLIELDPARLPESQFHGNPSCHLWLRDQ